MARYLIEGSYTHDGIKGLRAGGGSDRRKAVEEAIKSVGGTMESFYFAFGGADVYVVADLPGNVEAAALSLVRAPAAAHAPRRWSSSPPRRWTKPPNGRSATGPRVDRRPHTLSPAHAAALELGLPGRRSRRGDQDSWPR